MLSTQSHLGTWALHRMNEAGAKIVLVCLTKVDKEFFAINLIEVFLNATAFYLDDVRRRLRLGSCFRQVDLHLFTLRFEIIR